MTDREKPENPSTSDDLADLRTRVDAARTRREVKPVKNRQDDGRILGQAWRMSTELVVSVLVGLALGYGFDHWVGTSPWGLLVGLGLGFAAGIKTVLVSADKMAEQNAGVPRGDDMPDDEDDDE